MVQKVPGLVLKQKSVWKFGKYSCNGCMVMKEVKMKGELDWMTVQAFRLG